MLLYTYAKSISVYLFYTKQQIKNGITRFWFDVGQFLQEGKT